MKLTNLLKSLYFLFCLVLLFSCQKENLLSKDEQFDSKPDIKTVFESQKKNYKDPNLVNEQLTFLDSLKEEILWDKAITFGDTSYIPVHYLLPANYRNGSGGQYLETEQWLMAIYHQKANTYIFNMLEVYRSDKQSKVFSGTILAKNYFTKKSLSYANYEDGKFLKRDNKVASVGIVNGEDCISVYSNWGIVTDEFELKFILPSQIINDENQIQCVIGYKTALFRIGKISVGLPDPDEKKSYSKFTDPSMKYEYRCIDCLGSNSVNPYDEFPTHLGGGGPVGGSGGTVEGNTIKPKEEAIPLLIPFLVKIGTNAAADFLMQATMNYLFDPTISSWDQAFDNMNWWQVARSGAEGAIPWKTPGGRLGRAALTAIGDVAVNMADDPFGYSPSSAGRDFAIGFIGDLAGGGIGELVTKYGKTNVINGLVRKLGMDGSYVRRLVNGRMIFKVGEKIADISIKQIKHGTNEKYAIIGRSMGNATVTGVRDVYSELKNIQKLEVEIFDASSLSGIWKTKFEEASKEFAQKTNNFVIKLSNQELLQLKMYKLNKEWAQHLIDDGYTILDMGDFNNLGFSAFYAMEKATIFK